VRETERDHRPAAHGVRTDDLDPPEAQGGDSLRVRFHPGARPLGEVAHAAEQEEREEPREDEERNGEDGVGDRSPRLLGAHRFLGPRGDARGVDVQRFPARGRVHVAERDDRRLAHEDDRDAVPLFDARLGRVPHIDDRVERLARGARAFDGRLAGAVHLEREGRSLVDADDRLLRRGLGGQRRRRDDEAGKHREPQERGRRSTLWARHANRIGAT
jgi:hypothetical protein